jgi:hypothetical protein
MTHPILSMLPDDARNSHFEEEVDRLSRDLREEEVKARVQVLRDRKRTALPARSRSALSEKDKAQVAHDQLVRTHGSGYCHHG